MQTYTLARKLDKKRGKIPDNVTLKDKICMVLRSWDVEVAEEKVEEDG